MTKEFRIHSKKIYLTWSRCGVEIKVVKDLFCGKEHNVMYYCIAREKHKEEADCPYHLHCFLEYFTKVDIQNCRFYDMKVDDVVYHPNIQSAKNKISILNYIKKDGIWEDNEFNIINFIYNNDEGI